MFTQTGAFVRLSPQFIYKKLQQYRSFWPGYTKNTKKLDVEICKSYLFPRKLCSEKRLIVKHDFSTDRYS